MLILSIDSSATAASVALTEEDKLVGEFFVNTSFTHSVTLVPMIENLLSVTGKSVSDIGMIAVSNGPGSFTGVRIGVSVAKGIAFPEDIPCMAVSTLESMAYNLISTDCIVCAVMDARRNQVYNAIFRVKDGKIERLCDDRAVSIADLKEEIINKYSDERVILLGDGTDVTLKGFGEDSALHNVESAPYALRFQRASSVGMAARVRLSAGEEPVNSNELLPSYLRLSQAERERQEKQAQNN